MIKKYKVAIVYPTDPFAVVPGGTDTCIRDILRCAPEDIEMHLVGVTTDPHSFPPGQWTRCELNAREFFFYPLIAVPDLERQMRIPLSLKFTLKLIGRSGILANMDVIQINRIEPALSMLGLKKPRVLIIHQNMNVLNNKDSDIRWKHLPGFYFLIEDFVVNRTNEVFIVREDAVVEYTERFPKKSGQIHFLPTWMNPDLFFQMDSRGKINTRVELETELGCLESVGLLTFVGRLDYQKDPIYLIDSLAELNNIRSDWKMIMIGDGILRADVEERISQHGLSEKVILLGAKSQEDVARYLRSSDMLVLSSAYEGMPRCVVEALGCGIPVVTTKAGEVTLLIKQGENGYIVEPRESKLFSSYVDKTLNELDALSGQPCLQAVEKYRADVVLAKLYRTYRELAEHG
jgi:glycosyltransferase involved in cell wall biosynthesis